MDNFYTSIPLAEALYRLGTQITSTLRSNQIRIPEPLKKNETQKRWNIFHEERELVDPRAGNNYNFHSL